MSTRFVNVDRNTPMLLPPDLRDWVSEKDPVHFIIEAVQRVPMECFHLNKRGSGSAQYPPATMLALLVYCYTRGIFSSREIERATHRDVAVRYLTGDTHPDHDTIATFRRVNKIAIHACFKQVLLLAREIGLLKVGTVSVDGSHIKANASKFVNVRYDRAGELIEQLDLEIKELMERAEQADQQAAADDALPKELQRLETLRNKLDEARNQMEEQARQEMVKKRQEQEEKKRQEHKEKKSGEKESASPEGAAPAVEETPASPQAVPDAEMRQNLTDKDSRLMRKDQKGAYQQAYNAQAVVDADGTQLVLGTAISQSSNDARELLKDIQSIPQELDAPAAALADSGYANQTQVETLEGQGMNVYVRVRAESRCKRDFRPAPSKETPPSVIARSPFGQRMIAKLETDVGRALYALRKQTVEPVFGTIKKNMGFTQFFLRGLEKVELEWELVCLAYNMKRLWNLKNAPKKGGT